MRKLMWFAMGFAISCGFCAYGPGPVGLKLFCLLTVLFALAAWKVPYLARPALLLLGCTLGIFWYGVFQTQYLDAALVPEDTAQTLTFRASDFSRETDYGLSAEGTVQLEEKTYRVRAYLEGEQAVEPGTVLTGSFRVSATAPREDPVSYLSGEGIFLRLRQDGPLEAGNDPEKTWLDRVAFLRQQIREILADCFPADALPFAQALLLGDSSLLDYQTDTDFKVSGIRHVVAVSGLHVSILFALLGAVTFRKKFLTVPVGLGTLLLFAALAGFSASVTRACIMWALLLLALLFERQYDGPTALSFAVVVMLSANPLVVSSVSFQLSVASVAGIFCFRQKVQTWLGTCYPHRKKGRILPWLNRWVDTSVAVSVSAMVFTAPLCAWYFGMVSLVSVVTNLLALWVVSGIFYGILGVCGLYGFWRAAAGILGRIMAWPIRYVLAVASVMADLPLAAVYMNSLYTVLWFLFAYVLLAVFCVSRKRSPTQLICCCILGLCLALCLSWKEENLIRGASVTVLDVGQGQCILLQSEEGIWMVDCGGDTASRAADLAAAALQSRGIGRLNGMVLTHLDADHAGGAENLLTRMETDILILPPEQTRIAGLTDGPVVYATDRLELTSGETKITVFPATYPGTSNEKSLCVLFERENCVILITGDRDGFGERMLLRRWPIPEVDILIAGHHGSKYSTCEELLAAVSPETVCISAGKDDPFGHPAPELLRRLEDFGCTVYRTDIHGTVTIRR